MTKYIINYLGQGILILLMFNVMIAFIPRFIKIPCIKLLKATYKTAKLIYKIAIYPVIKQVFKCCGLKLKKTKHSRKPKSNVIDFPKQASNK